MPSGNLKVHLGSKGTVVLRPANYITTGGEASIYKVNDLIVKVFTDTQKMSADKMVEKVGILSKLSHKFIVNPFGVAEDEKHNPVGYYMGFVEGEPMSRVFTTAFRQRDGFSDQDAIQLVHNMREVPIFAHSHGAILVDANELNWLMRRDTQPEPRIVDVDSWQIGTRWPARVIMPSIRDYHSQIFDEHSDWFSWGIVTFQLFSGIHPYKGRHPDYKATELERRMRDNISVFNREVHLNAAVRDFSCIPGPLLDWYQRVFEHGERTQPPSPLDKTHTTTIIRQIKPVPTAASGALVFELILSAVPNNPIIRTYPCGVAVRGDGSLVEMQGKITLRLVSVQGKPLSAGAEIVRTERGYLIADQGQFQHVTAMTQEDLRIGMNHYGVLRSGNRLFAITDRGLTELNLMETAPKGALPKPILTIGQTWPVMRLATEWFDGLGVQNSLGAKYLILPFGDKGVSFVRTPELDHVNVVSAKAGHRFVTVVALDKNGDYQKFEFCLDGDYAKYTLWTGTTDSPDLNLAILPSGVCATIVQDGELSIFVPQNGNVNKVPDKKVATDMQLGTWGDRVIYIQKGEVWWVKMK